MDVQGLKKVYINQRGLGAAYREGIKQATNEIVYFTGIDFPFGLDNIKDCLKEIEDYDIIFASKAHPKSKISNSLKRRVTSKVFRFFLRIFLGLKIMDPQGCVMFHRKKINKILKYCDSDNAFFETQIALYSEFDGFKYLEIPVCYDDPRSDSKINIQKDGQEMLRAIIAERPKIKRLSKICKSGGII